MENTNTNKGLSSEIIKYDFDKAIINEIKSYKGFKVSDFKDENQVKELEGKYKVARDFRITIENQRKAIKQPVIDLGKEIDARANELKAETEDVEAELKAERDRVRELQKQEEERLERLAQETLNKRVAELKENGMKFEGEFYEISNISVDVSTIKKMDDEQYNVLLAKVKLEKQKLDEERKQREEEERKKREQEEKERAEFKRQQEELKKQQQEIERQKQEMERQRLEFEKQQREQERLNFLNSIKSIGFEISNNYYEYRTDDFCVKIQPDDNNLAGKNNAEKVQVLQEMKMQLDEKQNIFTREKETRNARISNLGDSFKLIKDDKKAIEDLGQMTEEQYQNLKHNLGTKLAKQIEQEKALIPEVERLMQEIETYEPINTELFKIEKTKVIAEQFNNELGKLKDKFRDVINFH